MMPTGYAHLQKGNVNTKYFAEFENECQRIQRAISHLPECDLEKVVSAWALGGIFLPDRGAMWDKNWKVRNPTLRSWINVAAHMSVAALLGSKIAEHAANALQEEGTSVRDATEALLVHDWNKRSEIKLLRRAKNVVDVIYRFDMRQNIRLRKWFSKRVLALVAVTGHGGVVTAEMRSLTLGEKITFYSDLCTSGSAITTYARRIEDLHGRMRAGETYARTEEYFQRQYGMSYREKHDELLLPIETELARLCSYSGPQSELPLILTPKEFHAPLRV